MRTQETATGSAIFEPVGSRHGTLVDVAYEQLLSAVIEGRLRPGVALGLDQLASQLGMSRTPVNLALSRLSAQRLVAYRNHAGFYVRTLTPDELAEIYDVRLMYERHAVESGVGRASDAQIDAIAAAHETIERSSNWVDHESFLRFFQLDARFHQLIVALPGSELLEKLFADLSYHVHGARYGLRAPQYDSFPQMAQEHRAIIAALRARDTQEAQAALTRHITRAGEVAIRRLRAQQDAAAAGSDAAE